MAVDRKRAPAPWKEERGVGSAKPQGGKEPGSGGRTTSQLGAAPVESVFAVAVLALLTLGVISLALTLYGRNVVMSSAHEGARAAVELRRDPEEAAAVAEGTVRAAIRGLVRDLAVEVTVEDRGTESIVEVHLTGVLHAGGPVSVPVPVDATATSIRANGVR